MQLLQLLIGGQLLQRLWHQRSRTGRRSLPTAGSGSGNGGALAATTRCLSAALQLLADRLSTVASLYYR